MAAEILPPILFPHSIAKLGFLGSSTDEHRKHWWNCLWRGKRKVQRITRRWILQWQEKVQSDLQNVLGTNRGWIAWCVKRCVTFLGNIDTSGYAETEPQRLIPKTGSLSLIQPYPELLEFNDWTYIESKTGISWLPCFLGQHEDNIEFQCFSSGLFVITVLFYSLIKPSTKLLGPHLLPFILMGDPEPNTQKTASEMWFYFSDSLKLRS